MEQDDGLPAFTGEVHEIVPLPPFTEPVILNCANVPDNLPLIVHEDASEPVT